MLVLWLYALHNWYFKVELIVVCHAGGVLFFLLVCSYYFVLVLMSRY